MKNISIELKTNSLANSIKLAVTLLIILAAAKTYYHYDFYGVNEVWFIPLMPRQDRERFLISIP